LAIEFAAPGGALSLIRLLPDGRQDTDFGLRAIAPGGSSEAAAVAVQADGKIVVAGCVLVGDTRRAVVLRLTANGIADTSVGDHGVVFVDFLAGASGEASSVAIQEDGKIVVAGSAGISTFDFALARLNSDGTLDPAFGTNGIVITDFGGTGGASALAV